MTAGAWLSLFFERSSVPGDLFNYFLHRFGQPRHLAALCLTSVLPKGERPLLDLACGCGHLAHFLTNGFSRHRVVGVDREFHQLWLAKEIIAPRGRYVCASLDEGIPFADRSFEGVICSDSFHYLRNKTGCLDDIRRSSPGGVQVFTRVGNVLVEPTEGWELSAEGYGDLFGAPGLRAFAEDALVDRYLLGLGPDLSSPTPLSSLRGAKWLSFLHCTDGNLLKEHGRFEEWPHAAGRLGPNPIFAEVGSSTGKGIQYQFKFPSPWFEFENRRMLEYHLENFVVSAELLRQLAEGTGTDQVEDLLAGFALLGLPERYV